MHMTEKHAHSELETAKLDVFAAQEQAVPLPKPGEVRTSEIAKRLFSAEPKWQKFKKVGVRFKSK